ncbi:Hypothetical predicted protein [Octopus vulgaris]|uniref:Uncharacterized protein n=1 Tax=Octopus vulgaris TaxID=6645 RepID=A0AA36BBE5_OCTVU|nr:Hypothetical predicted protein [Octopus vulgaris]
MLETVHGKCPTVVAFDSNVYAAVDVIIAAASCCYTAVNLVVVVLVAAANTIFHSNMPVRVGRVCVGKYQSSPRSVSPAMVATRSASGSGTSSGAEKCLSELGVGMVLGVGVGGATAESVEGDDAAAVVVEVLVLVVDVERRGTRLFFLFVRNSRLLNA